MLRELKDNYEQSSTKTNGRTNQGIVDTLTGLRQRSLRYTDESTYQSVATDHTFLHLDALLVRVR